MDRRLWIFTPFLLTLMCTAELCLAGDDYVTAATKLHKTLMEDYNSNVRPATANNETVIVTLIPEIVRVEDLDEGIGMLTITISIQQSWKDPRLSWKPQDHGGVKQIRLPLEKIWRPDIVLFNGPPDEASGFYDQLSIIMSDGTVVFVPFMMVSSYCGMDLTDFPYDTQTCILSFGSWTYSSDHVRMEFLSNENKTSTDVIVQADDKLEGQKRSHPSWDVVGKKAEGHIIYLKFDCCEEKYGLMNIRIQLKRKPQFFKYVVVGPSIVLAILVPIQFLFPVLGSQRTTFGLLILLCFTMLLLNLQLYIPMEHSSVPDVGKFYMVTMIFSALAVFLSAITASIASTDRRKVPSWLKTACLGRCGFWRFLCVELTFPTDDQYRPANSGLLSEAEGPHLETFPQSEQEMENYSSPSEHLRSLAHSASVLAGKAMADGARERQKVEWMDIARIMDRLFFIVFSFMFIISLFTYVA